MIKEKSALEKALNERKSRGLIYEAFQKYDEVYQNAKGHSAEERSEYVELYFRFLEYVNKARWNTTN